jgi:hypothetical protein
MLFPEINIYQVTCFFANTFFPFKFYSDLQPLRMHYRTNKLKTITLLIVVETGTGSASSGHTKGTETGFLVAELTG